MKVTISCEMITITLLSWKDSNPHKRNQNPVCYRYTTGQFFFLRCKGNTFFGIDKR